MSAAFEELDCRDTPQGELVLRRRRALSVGGAVVHEVLLDGEFLMSSLVDASERALATLPLGRLRNRPSHVLVGGLGLGATAHAALRCPDVRSVTVVEFSPAVVDWHRRGLVPLAAEIAGDPRCRILEADFFRLIQAGGRLDGVSLSPERFDAILVDIDHSPSSLLHPSHAGFYTRAGLERTAGLLEPGGVFALWSAEIADADFTGHLNDVFDPVELREVKFFNPLLDVQDANTIYIGVKPE